MWIRARPHCDIHANNPGFPLLQVKTRVMPVRYRQIMCLLSDLALKKVDPTWCSAQICLLLDGHKDLMERFVGMGHDGVDDVDIHSDTDTSI